MDGIPVQIHVVSLTDGKIIIMSENELVNKEKRKLKLRSIPFSLTCILHKNHILADPTADEEAIMETIVTIALDSSSRLVSFYKPGRPVLAYTIRCPGMCCIDKAKSSGTSRDFRGGHFWYGDRLNLL